MKSSCSDQYCIPTFKTSGSASESSVQVGGPPKGLQLPHDEKQTTEQASKTTWDQNNRAIDREL